MIKQLTKTDRNTLGFGNFKRGNHSKLLFQGVFFDELESTYAHPFPAV